jgi:hypothetical protein
MNEMERQGRFIEAQRAQTGVTVDEALEMLRNDGKPDTSIELGLEIRREGEPDEPREMSEVDSDWEGFVERQANAATEPWDTAAAAVGEAVLTKAVAAWNMGEDDEVILGSAVNLLTTGGPDRYVEFLSTV